MAKEPQLSPMELELKKLKEENARLVAEKANPGTQPLTLKVSEKGGVSLYGMGRFPVTLYQEQWEKMLNHADTIKAFIAANKDKLKLKETKAA